MKKLPTLLISILITSAVFSSLFSAKTQALQTDENDITWYTVPELLAYKEEDDREEQELCGEDLACLKALRDDKLANNPKYNALILLEYRQFAITSINIRDNKIKILFFNEDMRAKQANNAKRDTELKLLYMAWVDSTIAEPINLDRNMNKYFNGEMVGVYTLYAHREENDGAGWFTEKDREVEIEVPADSDLKSNVSKTIHYKMSSKYSNTTGHVGYSRCLSEVDNNPNAECVAMFSAEKGLNYFASVPPETPDDDPGEDKPVDDEPSDDEPSDDEPINDEPANDDPEPADELISDNEPTTDEPSSSEEEPKELEPEEPEVVEDNTAPQDELNISEPSVSKEPNITTPTPKAPDTGSMSSPCVQKTTEFPWWLCIIIALGDMAVLWLFWPTPKSHKNPKKV